MFVASGARLAATIRRCGAAATGATDSSACTCAACDAGRYTPKGYTKCFDCPAGRFQSSFGQAYCHECPQGKHQASPCASACTECAAGQFQPAEAQTQGNAAPETQEAAAPRATEGMDDIDAALAELLPS